MPTDNPLLQIWLEFAQENGNTRSSFEEFVNQQLSGELGKTNVDVPGSTATALGG